MTKRAANTTVPMHAIPLVLIALILHNCAPTRNQSIKEWEKQHWKMVKEEKESESNWTIKRRKISNTELWEYKIEGGIALSPREGAKRFREEIHHLAKGSDPKKYPTYKILDESKDSLLTYLVHHEPFPFKNTEMCVQYVFHKDDHRNITIEWKESWGNSGIEPTKKLKRVDIFRGSVRFSSKTDNKTQFVQTVQFDPKGMPMWLAGPMVEKFLKMELRKFRKDESKDTMDKIVDAAQSSS